jgi:glycosyltransferase involved in cell wall biosynthesis
MIFENEDIDNRKYKKPLLSICIPTYNRAEYLDKSIASLVCQNEFNSEDVELVISDNASTDNTEGIVKKYQEQYKNIFYSKNEKNNEDKNFPTVISKAHGVFRKLCNDTIIFMDESVNYMLSIIKDNIYKKPILFFMSHANKRRRMKKYTTINFDSFIKIVSFWTTWIGGFGIWEDDFEKIENKFDGCEIHLWQTKVLLEIVARKNVSIIDNIQFFSTQECQKKNLSYGLFQVFYSNYLGLYHQYMMKKILSVNVFEYLRKHLLFDFFLGWIVNFHFDYTKYEIRIDDDTEKLILDKYCHDKYYFYFYFKLKIAILKKHIKKFIKNKKL